MDGWMDGWMEGQTMISLARYDMEHKAIMYAIEIGEKV
jgi:hypothetical protein